MSLVRSKAGGFTLIELAIVIAIIGILAGAAIFNFQNNLVSAENAKADATLSALNSGLAMYIAENLDEPAAFADFVGTDATDTVSLAGDAGCDTNTPLVCTWAYREATYAFDGNGGITMTVTDV